MSSFYAEIITLCFSSPEVFTPISLQFWPKKGSPSTIIHSKYQGLNNHIGVSNSPRVSHSHLASFQVCASQPTEVPPNQQSVYQRTEVPPNQQSVYQPTEIPPNQKCLPTNRGASQPKVILPTNSAFQPTEVPPNR